MRHLLYYPLTLLFFACETTSVTNAPEDFDAVAYQKVTLDFVGPETSEMDETNPFTDYRLDVTFTHGSGHALTVPGFYAGDGDAAESGAEAGNVWQVRFRPDRPGDWTYVADWNWCEDAGAGDKSEGILSVGPAAPAERGRLIRAHPRYLQWSHSKNYFLKAGTDSPENLLGYEDFDGTYRHLQQFRVGENATEGLHHFRAHAGDFTGGPTWQNGKGKNLLGALSYLAGNGINSVYFLVMNINGDGKDVWPYVDHETLDRFDVSKLDQWERVFDYADDSLGMNLHFVLQETENETLLDDGDTGPLRQLYFRELVARFGHHRAVTWNLGEENGPNNWSETAQTNEQQEAMLEWFAENDPYHNYTVLHTHPGPEAFAKIYEPLLGNDQLGGLAMQLGYPYNANELTRRWIALSQENGAPWIVSLDEVGPWYRGLDPDAGGPLGHNHDSLRALTLYGNLLAGGAGVEWYFGARNVHNDLNMEDWRSRDAAWKWTSRALDVFHKHLPFAEMESMNERVTDGNFCFGKVDEVYAVGLPFGGIATLNLGDFAPEKVSVTFVNPRTEGLPETEPKDVLVTNGRVILEAPDGQDWLAVIK